VKFYRFTVHQREPTSDDFKGKPGYRDDERLSKDALDQCRAALLDLEQHLAAHGC